MSLMTSIAPTVSIVEMKKPNVAIVLFLTQNIINLSIDYLEASVLIYFARLLHANLLHHSSYPPQLREMGKYSK